MSLVRGDHHNMWFGRTNPSGGVGGLASPLTVIVSGGFADGAGRFPLAENIPYAKERPWALAHSDEAQTS